MKPDKLTVREIFERERRYTIPLYQRSYVWTRENQWAPLWEDIARQAEHCYENPYSENQKTHFLGAIVLNVIKIVGRSLPRSEVIDGQQRLTTLQIFLAALRDYAGPLDDHTSSALRRLTSNPDRPDGSEEALKVWPTNADRHLFTQIMCLGSPASVHEAFAPIERPQNLPRMAEAYLFFHECIRDFVEEKGDDAATMVDRLYAIMHALRTALQFVIIELEDSDDPQVIFETLNARGQPLLPSDLIRNYVFLQASSEHEDQVDELYNKYWRPFDDHRLDSADDSGENRFWHIQERQGRLIRPRIDLFMFHFLVMTTELEIAIGNLFKEFRNWHANSAQKIPALLGDIQNASTLFSRLVSPEGSKPIDKFAVRLKSLDTSTVYPLLLYLMGLKSDRLPQKDFDTIIHDLESYLIRRFICNLTTKNYNRFFLSLLQKVRRAANKGESIALAAREELLRSDDATAVWPSDAQFRHGWLNQPVYVKSRLDRCSMVLRALEEGLRTDRTEGISLRSELSVEHLMPRNGRTRHYPYADDIEFKDGETREQARERFIHTLGNLTLLTQKLNASIGNGKFTKKRQSIVADSDLRLNAWLRNDDRTQWTEKDIQDRGSDLFEIALKLWPKPTSTKTMASEPA